MIMVARIDYTKSDEKLVLGDREVAMPDDAAYHQLVVPNAKHASLVLSDGSVLYVNAGTRVFILINSRKTIERFLWMVKSI